MTRDLPEGAGYFLYHSIGQYPGKAADLTEAMAEFAGVWGRADDGQWPYALGKRAAFVERWRAIIGAPSGTVTTCDSVTAGLHMLLSALPKDVLTGKRVLVAGDCFPSNHFLLTGLQERYGFRLDTVPQRQGASWVEQEDLLARWGADVGLCLLTWVSSTSSHRIDLAAAVAYGRAIGSLVGVDITQAAGLLPYDVLDPAVDFTLSTSLKWMCGTPGAGMLHVASGLIADCQPELRGWFSQPDPFNWALDRFDYAPDIRRFDAGTPGVMAAVASLAALDWHAAQDFPALAAHNRRLSTALIEGLDDLGLRFASPRNPAERGGSVMLLLPEGLGSRKVVDELRTRQVFVDARGQVLRMSPGAMTRPEGVAALLTALADCL